MKNGPPMSPSMASIFPRDACTVDPTNHFAPGTRARRVVQRFKRRRWPRKKAGRKCVCFLTSMSERARGIPDPLMRKAALDEGLAPLGITDENYTARNISINTKVLEWGEIFPWWEERGKGRLGEGAGGGGKERGMLTEATRRFASFREASSEGMRGLCGNALSRYSRMTELSYTASPVSVSTVPWG